MFVCKVASLHPINTSNMAALWTLNYQHIMSSMTDGTEQAQPFLWDQNFFFYQQVVGQTANLILKPKPQLIPVL